MAAPMKVDVFISGAGPVGLILAYQLLRLGHSVYIIDAADKGSPDFPMYGRASTLHARSLEMLDQMDLFDEMAQVGVAAASSFTYRDGKHVQGRGWKVHKGVRGETFFAFSLNIRLKYSEDIFRRRLGGMGVEVDCPSRLVDFEVDENAGDDHPVIARYTDVHGDTFAVKAKYIVGADGGGSTVRKLAGIPFVGDRKAQHWVRVDGVVKTNIPEARLGFGLFETFTHGHVLWVALDHGATRIGYALSDDLYQKYGAKMSREDAVKEAQRAVAPFELEFTQVDWYTVYGVQQHVAERFQDRKRILLAGDAAHTHSSGSAQGMNVGIHDVVSLSWRLSGALKGWHQAQVLATYSQERRAVAQQLIENDKTISALLSGRRPDHLKNDGRDIATLVDDELSRQSSFGHGLGIWYPASILNNVTDNNFPLTIAPGHRATDFTVTKPGKPGFPVRLFELTKYNGKFRILVFAGTIPNTASALQTLRAKVDLDVVPYAHAVEFLTIIGGADKVVDEHLGVKRFGDAFWDADQSAHTRYGIPLNMGALVILRPDGILGHTGALDDFDGAVEYLKRLIVPLKQKEVFVSEQATRKELGDFIAPAESNLACREDIGLAFGGEREEGVAGKP